MNLQIEQLKQSLQSTIAQSQLPVGVVSLVIHQIADQIDRMYFEQVQKELNEQKEEKSDESE